MSQEKSEIEQNTAADTEQGEAEEEGTEEAMDCSFEDDGFFDFQVTADLYVQFSHDLFGEILSWIPAYPYLYCLRRVCKKWKRELEERIYEQRVQLLDLLPCDRTVDAHKGYRNFLNFRQVKVNLDEDGTVVKKTGGTKKKGTKASNAYITRESVIDCLGACFPNVKILRFQMDEDMIMSTQNQDKRKKYQYRQETFAQLKRLLRFFPRLEHLVIVCQPMLEVQLNEPSFVREVTSALWCKKQLRTVTVVSMPFHLANWDSILSKSKALKALPKFERFDFKYALADKHDLDSKMAQLMPTSSVMEQSNEISFVGYHRYMIEKLQYSIFDILIRKDHNADLLYPLEFAIRSNMPALVAALLPYHRRWALREGTLYQALNMKPPIDATIIRLLAEKEAGDKDETKLLHLLLGLVGNGTKDQDMCTVLDRISSHLTQGMAFRILQCAVEHKLLGTVKLVIEKHPKVKDEPAFQTLLHRTVEPGVLEFLAHTCGLSFVTTDRDRTFMSSVFEMMYRTGEFNKFDRLLQFVEKNQEGGISRLLCQQASADGISALQTYLSCFLDKPYERYKIQDVGISIEQAVKGIWILGEEKSGKSYLQLFSRMSSSNLDDTYSRTTYMADEFLGKCPPEECLQALFSACNAVFIHRYLMSRPVPCCIMDIIDAQIRATINISKKSVLREPNAFLYVLFSKTSEQVGEIAKATAEKYYGNDLLDVLRVQNPYNLCTIFHVLARDKNGERNLRTLLEGCGNARRGNTRYKLRQMLSLTDRTGHTAMSLAIQNKFGDTVRALINFGCDAPSSSDKEIQAILAEEGFNPFNKYIQISEETSGKTASASSSKTARRAGQVRGRKRKQTEPEQEEDEEDEEEEFITIKDTTKNQSRSESSSVSEAEDDADETEEQLSPAAFASSSSSKRARR